MQDTFEHRDRESKRRHRTEVFFTAVEVIGCALMLAGMVGVLVGVLYALGITFSP